MTTNPRPVYRRILLKLSGEALMGNEDFGIDPNRWIAWPPKSKNLLNTVFR